MRNILLVSLFFLSLTGFSQYYNVSETITLPTCHDGNDGSINITVSGGMPPYTFTWSNGATTEDIAGLFAGTYTVVIRDIMMTSDTMITYVVNNPPAVDFNINITPPACGSDDGSATATVVTGTSPYTYQWSSGDTLSTADSLSAGIYMLVVTDADGCSSSETFGVNNTNSPVLSASVTNTSCAGVFDGAIDLSVLTGAAPYTYSWSNASANEDLANLKPGAYMVQVTDANNCTSVLTVSVGTTVIDMLNFMANDPSGCGVNDGSVTVNPMGGAVPYTYQWSANAGGGTTNTATNLGPGAFYLTVTDANGCSEIHGYMLSNPGGPAVMLNSVTSAHCDGLGGNVNISASGVMPITYQWSNGAFTEDLNNVAQGTYDLDAIDGNGCVTMFQVIVPGMNPAPITLCLTTVDSATGKVVCVWEKPALDYISHFNIYRENAVAGQYDFWFSKPYDSLSQWTDQTANPVIRGWRYKVTIVDTCGNESNFGTNHKTIHLNANIGVGGVVNLIWDDYEGFPYSTVYISRYYPATGWEIIDSLPSSLHSYTDVSPPGFTDLRYTIDVKPPSVCTSTRAVNHNYTRSNRGSFSQPTGTPLVYQNQLEASVFPNPSNGKITIELLNTKNSLVEISDLAGRVVFTATQNTLLKEYSLDELSNGVYLVKLTGEGKQLVTKLVKK